MVRQGRILMADASIYDQLAKESFSDLTITQLNTGTSVTAVDQASVNYWKGPLTLSRVLQASRTYAGGTLPIPESGSIVAAVIAAGDNVIIQPSGTEIWRMSGMSMISSGSAATVALAFFDGTTFQYIKTGISTSTSAAAPTIIGAYGATSDVEVLSLPLLISNSKYLVVFETGGSVDVALTYSYDKMSL
jgi:hypothetical protein